MLPEPDLQTHVNMLGTGMYTMADPGLGRQRQEEELWGLLASQSILMDEFQVNERPSQSWIVFLQDTTNVGLCRHMHPSHHTK